MAKSSARGDAERLFWDLFRAPTEAAVDEVLAKNEKLADPKAWRAYGQNESNFGVVENQQASPIPALIEKVINSIDAILMRRCQELGIDPKSAQAPHSIEDAIAQFFPDSASWDLTSFRKSAASSIQIIADGPRMETSLVIFDDGEGQHPEDFERTFLSLLRGNKNEIHFVQGKYNMGGAGAIAFCGKRRYQLVGSRRFDKTGPFGFTLLRRHPLVGDERTSRKSTWYEYLMLDGRIPAFSISELNLGLHERRFSAGTIIKLYSYDLPAGSRSVISRDLNQSINEYLFNPAIPILTVDTAERYPHDRNLQRELFGLKRRLEEEGSKYVAEFFSEDYADQHMGRIKVTCYVFQPRIEGRTAKETKESIQREFFKNNMSVLFSLHGQVHGHYTSEFITRSLKFPLLKDYLLVHVDCTDLHMEFRDELFMASRDRLKDADESRTLRQKLAEILTGGRLKEVYAARKSSISVEGKDTSDLIRNFTRNLPLQSELVRLLNQTFKLEDKRTGEATGRNKGRASREGTPKPAFKPERFPSFFRIERKQDDDAGMPVVQVPLGTQRTVRFATDVEDQYFDRVSDPGDLQIAPVDLQSAKAGGGAGTRLPDRLEDVLNVVKSSPHNGTIRVTVNPTKALRVGDVVKLRAELSGAGTTFEQFFLVRVSDPEVKKERDKPKDDQPDNQLGLPRLVLVYKEPGRGNASWDQLEAEGIEMTHNVVMHPLVEGETLAAVYVNMDASVVLSYKARLATEEALEAADKRFLSSVYFHTLFLYTITRSRKYAVIRQSSERDEPVELTEFLKDLFQSYYSEFLLNFEMQELIAALEG